MSFVPGDVFLGRAFSAIDPLGFVACPSRFQPTRPVGRERCVLCPPLLVPPFPTPEFKQAVVESVQAGSIDPLSANPKASTSLGASAHDRTHEKLNRHRAYRESCTEAPLCSPLARPDSPRALVYPARFLSLPVCDSSLPCPSRESWKALRRRGTKLLQK